VKIVHFHNGTGGGVLSVIRNLLSHKQRQDLEYYVIYIINRDKVATYNILGLEHAYSEQVFYYSVDWNFYYTCRQLAKLLPSDDALLVAHDWLELGMISHLGLNNPTLMILHGDYDYYYNLAVKHANNLDIFICVALNIAEELKKKLTDRIEDIYYRPFPVREPIQKTLFSGVKRLLFIGRCEKEKGYNFLPIIEQNLRRNNCELEWTIVGQGNGFENVKWKHETRITFLGEVANDEVLKILHMYDVILLPSLAEGMPVAIIEAMKAGVIPIVNDISGGIQELIENNITGYKIVNNNPEEYAVIILTLFNSPDFVKKLGINCINRASEWFNPIKNTIQYELLYQKATLQNRKKIKHKIFGSRLDKPWLPNELVYQIRKRTKKMNHL
jgi:glycosyltransferase involved in cell wall biosynthesis